MGRVLSLFALACLLACRAPKLQLGDAAPDDIAVLPTPRSPWPRPAPPPRHDAGAAPDVFTWHLDGGVTAERPGAAPAGLVRLARSRAGLSLVWTVEAERGTDLVAQRLDADGNLLGAARTLRTVPGRVQALDADGRDGLLWVAWSSSMGSLGRFALRRTGAVVATDDLSVARGPVVFEDLRVWPIRRRWASVFAEIRAGDDGTAVALVSGDNTACPLGPAGVAFVNYVDCPGWKWFRVSQRPGMLFEGRGGVMNPALGPTGLTRVRGGWVYTHGPIDGAPATPRVIFDPIHGNARRRVLGAFTETTTFCERARVAWTGDAWVSACEPVAASGEPERTVWVRVVRADGTAATTARTTASRLTAETLRCVGDRPVVELRWEGGVARLDPGAPDANFHLEQWTRDVWEGVDAVAWAGRAVVGLVARTGSLRRWRCNAVGEVVAQ